MILDNQLLDCEPAGYDFHALLNHIFNAVNVKLVVSLEYASKETYCTAAVSLCILTLNHFSASYCDKKR